MSLRHLVFSLLFVGTFTASCGQEEFRSGSRAGLQSESGDLAPENLNPTEPPEIPRTPFERAMIYWRNQGSLCAGYPSKEQCDDGDATLFNGLLCASGEQVGCDAVAAAQGSDGRWWRSPRRVGDNAGQSNSFSRDMSLGVLLYLQTTGDEARARSWLKWIDDNRPCSIKNPVTGGCSVWGLHRVCRDDDGNRCSLTPTMWAMFATVWGKMGWSKHNEMKVHSGAYDSFAAQEVEQTDLGYALHLKSVQAFITLKADPQHGVARQVVATLMRRQSQNPFFQWLDKGAHSDWESHLLNLCPSAERPSRRFHQWSWERDTAERAWEESMVWDCLFLGNLAKSRFL